MGLAVVFVAPPFSLLVTLEVVFLGALACLLRLQGIDFPLELLYYFCCCLHGGVLSCHVVGLRVPLSFQASICVSEVSHWLPFLCRRLREVEEGFLDAYLVVGSVAALA